MSKPFITGNNLFRVIYLHFTKRMHIFVRPKT